MLDTATANKLIQAVNQILSLIVAPNGAGKLVSSDAGVILDLSGLIALVTKVQTSQDAITQTTSPGTPGGGGGGGDLNGKINAVINALNAASINAICNDDGSVSVTLVIPGLPPPT